MDSRHLGAMHSLQGLVGLSRRRRPLYLSLRGNGAGFRRGEPGGASFRGTGGWPLVGDHPQRTSRAACLSSEVKTSLREKPEHKIPAVQGDFLIQRTFQDRGLDEGVLRALEDAVRSSARTQQALAPSDFEIGRGSRVGWARLKFSVMAKTFMGRRSQWDWHHHPSGAVRLMESIREETSINMKEEWNVVSADDLDAMLSFPFIFMHAELPVNLSASQKDKIGINIYVYVMTH